MRTTSAPTSTLVQVTMTASSLSRAEVVASVADLLRVRNDSLSTTITRQGTSEDSYVFSATSEFLAPDLRTFLSALLHT